MWHNTAMEQGLVTTMLRDVTDAPGCGWRWTTVMGFSEHGSKFSGSIQDSEFLHHLS
jgi:hypothetical protein